jgi:methylmalonyl-CoA mutase N-terminal domain/subunit
MQILIEEIGLCDTVDPLAGSYYVETLTNQMEERIRALMADVDAQGGIVKAIIEGRIQDAVSRQALDRVRKLERGEIRRVGMNCYRVEEDEERPIEFHPFKEDVAAEQIARLDRIRAERDNDAVRRALDRVRTDADKAQNVMPAVVEAGKHYASVGELTKCLVEVYGRYQEPVCL